MARRCLDAHIRGFTEFEGFCTDRFRPGTQSFKSAMFTNFITPARGRTGFYHCSPDPPHLTLSAPPIAALPPGLPARPQPRSNRKRVKSPCTLVESTSPSIIHAFNRRTKIFHFT
ncbi:hypothetical protein CUJ89_06385 [Burkholderia pyrrocinia]|uniref:Uncharacterized protein n=1 Tax=Burkholderia pyrrocinia TaxID=60550 RepID=A0A2Z5MUM4_BURPY|nr:hypothetical protein CUJ89_06385 [Burkholderia pyrrocinia]